MPFNADRSENAPSQKALGKGPFGAGGFGQSVERGAIPIIFAATSDEMSGTVQVCRAAAAGLASERGEITRTPSVSVLTCGACIWQRILLIALFKLLAPASDTR